MRHLPLILPMAAMLFVVCIMPFAVAGCAETAETAAEQQEVPPAPTEIPQGTMLVDILYRDWENEDAAPDLFLATRVTRYDLLGTCFAVVSETPRTICTKREFVIDASTPMFSPPAEGESDAAPAE